MLERPAGKTTAEDHVRTASTGMAGDATKSWRDGVRRMLALAARPVRRAQGQGTVVVEPYRGYGSTTQAFLIGRVFRQRHADPKVSVDDVRTNLRDIGRRIRRRAVAGVTVVARLGDTEARVATDRDGYFRLHLRFQGEVPPDEGGWHTVDLTLDLDPPVHALGRIFIPSARCRLAVVSDIDDTVTETGVANKLVMLWRLFVATADSRVAFPGVAAFYRALHDGATGDEENPILYVSRAPWGTYDMLTAFFRRHRIPVGPEMFLREWGLSWRHPWPRRAEDHKRELIGNMMALYPDLPFVLIGDSGQHDPEVYARIVRENPGRVTAVYIRNVSQDAARLGEIARLTEAVAATGSSLVLATDSVAMARHAAGLGMVSAEAVAAVAENKEDGPVASLDADPPPNKAKSGRRSAT